MLSRDKMYIIADNVDESIKMQTTSYDITIFKTIVEFEKWIDMMPVVVDTIIVTTDVLPFTGNNAQRLERALKSPFLTLTGSLIYLVDKTYNQESIHNFLESRGLDWVFYCEDITTEYIASVVSGEGRRSDETQSEIITYRVRANEYIKQQNLNKLQGENDQLRNHYQVDDELLSGIPDEEEPEEVNPTTDLTTEVKYIVGKKSMSRTLLAFLTAQYLSLKDRTLIMERDVDFHTLTELATKHGMVHCYIDVTELMENFQKTITKIVGAQEKLIIIGSKKRVKYSYTFMMSVLYATLKGKVKYILRECDFEETVYGRSYTMVMENNVPAALESCSLLRNDVDENLVSIVGVQIGSLGPVNLTSKELREVLTVVLGKNNLKVQVMKIDGISLKGEDSVYDIFSFIKGDRG